jgi:transcriptional regulator with XRE-family HTH domain
VWQLRLERGDMQNRIRHWRRERGLTQEALGRLVASLGAPEEVGVAGTEHGLCEGDDGRYARWAQLTVIVLGTVADGTFVGYRYQEPSVPTSLINLATPSGIRLGDDIAALNETYASFTITYETVAGATTFRLFEDAELLLWGPVSSTDDNGRIEGIYSPAACDGA